MALTNSGTHWLVPMAEFAGLRSFPIADDPSLDELAKAWEQIAFASGLSEKELLERVSAYFRIAVARLGGSTSDARSLVSPELVQQFCVLPLRLEGDVVEFEADG